MDEHFTVDWIIETSYSIPPALQRRPRKVKRRRGTGCAVIFPRLFILPHIIIGIGLLTLVPVTLASVFFGQLHQGRVINKSTSSGKKGTYYQIRYEYEAGGRKRADERPCSRAQYDQMGDVSAAQASQPIEVRTLNLLGHEYKETFLPGESHWAPIRWIAWPALLWNAFLSVFLWILYVDPWRKKRLVRYGQPVVGRVFRKHVQHSRSETYYLDCAFDHPGIGPRQVEISVQPHLYNLALEGEAVTMLCYPGHKRPVTVYEYGDFECV